MSTVSKYGLNFPEGTDDSQIEQSMIREGGQWKGPGGIVRGHGLFFHYKRMFRLFWPEDDDHRWEDAELQAILDNQFTTLMGSSGSVKTTTAAKFILCFWSTWPDETTVLVSSTDLRGLELRVFGRLKELHERAKNRYDWFPGFVLDSKKVIATDNIEETQARDLRQGIICIPCISPGGSFVGLGKYIGIHNTRLLFVGDEFQLMRESILDAIPNLLNNPIAKFIFLGNPLAQNDPLDRVSEPREGWSSIGVPTKTIRWRTKFMDGLCLNLPGLDSPNFDFPEDKPDRFPYMVGRRKATLVAETYGKDSQQYCSQILGVRVTGLTARKVVTRELCDQFHAFDKPIWRGDPRTKIYAVDAAYGTIGGDRCIGGWIEFGVDTDGHQLLNIGLWKLIPVSALSKIPPDDQIAEFVKQDCESEGIEPENVFFDGRTLLATAFARIWSAKVNPVDFGGRTTNRPVSNDIHIFDDKTGHKRLKLCAEHYSKFVTELWFSVRYCIESSQLRGMTEEVLNDGFPREWKTVRGNLIEIETKREMKNRTGKSPDLFDQLATAVEGARRRGFQIAKLGAAHAKSKEPDWLEKQRKDYEKLLSDRRLQAA
jgi:hypothetical protein